MNKPKSFNRVKKEQKDWGSWWIYTNALKNIKDNLLVTQEVQFKINQDIDRDLLVSPKKQGYTHNNILDLITAPAMSLAFNPSIISTKVEICVDLAKPSKLGP